MSGCTIRGATALKKFTNCEYFAVELTALLPRQTVFILV